MNILLVLPVLVPFLSAATGLLLWRRPAIQRRLTGLAAVVHVVAAVALLGTVWRAGIQAEQLGGWPAPFGITFVADLFSAIMVLVAALVVLAVIVYSRFTIDPGRESFAYYPLLHVLLMGVCGAFLTGDLFNLYVWFEVMLMASFVLLALGGERPQMEGAIKYVTLNLIASAMFLAAVGLLYGMAGTLNMADLARKLASVEEPAHVSLIAVLFLVAFGIKSAVFPLFFWLPASYHTPPPAVSAVFAGLLTKVGVYALIRTFTLLFVGDVAFTHSLILGVAGLTMVTGVLGAAAQSEFRRILSFHIVSQIGYMLMGLGLIGVTPLPHLQKLALAGSIFYIVHHIIVKTNLFLVSGVVRQVRGSYELKELGGLYRDGPLLSVLFLIPAFSLSGVPPLSGFFSKLILVRAGLEMQQYAIVAAALAVGLLTLFSMTKIWAEVFWKAAPAEPPPAGRPPPAPEPGEEGLAPAMARQRGRPASAAPEFARGVLAPIVLLAGLTVLIGLAAGPVFQIAERAAEELLQPERYIAAVLGESP